MQGHRSDLWPAGVAPPGTPAHEHQRRLLLELAVEPPTAGDRVEDLARTLELTPVALKAAADALIAVGLVERRDGRLFPSAATRAIDALWPLAL
jgi:hypothetical protein